jgi:hypothetical protein
MSERISSATKLRRARAVLLSIDANAIDEPIASILRDGLRSVTDVLLGWAIRLEAELPAQIEDPPAVDIAFADRRAPLRAFIRLRGDNPDVLLALTDQAEAYLRGLLPSTISIDFPEDAPHGS